MCVYRSLFSLLAVGVAFVSGCAAIHPIHGIPARELAFESDSRSEKATIDLSLLVQSKPDEYRIGPGDVLSVYVPGVLGKITERDDEVGETPPINQPRTNEDIPTVGFPLTVRDNGTLPLPQVAKAIYVQGMTLGEVEQAVLRAYTEDSQVLNPERARVLVSLARPREYEVLVVRQEKSSEVAASAPNIVNVGRSRRGTARTVRLKAYQNDVLHALSEERDVDGLPGLDAENTIYIIRRRRAGDAWPAAMHAPADGCSPMDETYVDPYAAGPETPLPYGVQPPQLMPTQPAPYMPSPQYGGAPQFDQPSPAGPTMTPMPTYAPQAMPSAMGTGHSAFPSQQTIPAGYSTASPNHQPVTHAAIRGQSPIAGGSPFASSRIAAMPGHTGHDPFGGPAAGPMIGHGSFTPAETTFDSGCDTDWSWQQALADFDPTVENPHVIKIPIRLSPGERPNFSESDIILEDGDIVFIESRDTEVFYTAGLLGGGQWELPRDYDLRLLEAISIAQGPQNVQVAGNSNGQTAINGDITVSGSRVVVLRTLPGGARVPIETSIYAAIKHPEENNIKIQPGDMVYLQYTCPEAVLAFLERHLLETALFGFGTGFLDSDN